jgi:hypothetical protein
MIKTELIPQGTPPDIYYVRHKTVIAESGDINTFLGCEFRYNDFPLSNGHHCPRCSYYCLPSGLESRECEPMLMDGTCPAGFRP